MRVGDERRDGVLAVLRGLIEPVRAAPGSQGAYLYEGVKPYAPVCFSTEWKDQHSLEDFMRSPAYGSVLNVMEMASEAPVVWFETVSQTRGMEYLVEVCLPEILKKRDSNDQVESSE